jgi:hypothetical protein
MQEILNFFNQGWVGSLIGLIGIVLGGLGIVSYKISKSIAKPAYQRSSLREFVANGLVRTQRGSLAILDVPGLQKLISFPG